MNRLFGSSKPKDPPPNLSDTITKLDERVSGIEKKIHILDLELAGYKEQLAKLNVNNPSREFVKQRALRALQQKKIFEQQVAQMRQQSFNMEQAAFATETLKDNQATVKAMQASVKEMRRQYNQVSLNTVEHIQDDLEDLMESSNELQNLMSRSYAMPDGIDDADLEAELEALEGLEADADQGYLDALPPTPMYPPVAPTKQTDDTAEANQQIKF